MNHLKIQHLGNSSLDGLDSWITKFKHLIAIDANQVVVLLKAIGFFELSQVFPKLMFGH